MPDGAMDAFSTDYFDARDRFLSAAENRGLHVERQPLRAAGRGRQTLSIDVASCGSPRPERAVVISSGMHGVEGFLGSAVQLQLLADAVLLPECASPMRLVLVHGLNPFGFAWLRRVNEASVDLNRNFLPPDEPYRGCPPQYAALDHVLNPRYPGRLRGRFRLRLVLAGLRYGPAALKEAIAIGQYEFPRGLFFGGAGPSETLEIVRRSLGRWTADARQVVHLDFHTGLGRWSACRLLADYSPRSAQLAWFERCFGRGSVEVTDPKGVAYRTRGSLGAWCQRTFAECQYNYLCAEFGTYGALAVLESLRDENRLSHWAAPDDPRLLAARRRLMEAFCPSSARWRRRTLATGVALCRAACAACG